MESSRPVTTTASPVSGPSAGAASISPVTFTPAARRRATTSRCSGRSAQRAMERRHDGAHAVHLLQRLLARVEDGVQFAEARRQQPRRLRARVADAEGEEQVGQRTFAAGRHARDEVGRVAGAEAAVVEAQVRQLLHGRIDAFRRPRLHAGAVLRAGEGAATAGPMPSPARSAPPSASSMAGKVLK